MTHSEGRTETRMRTLVRILVGVLVVALVAPFVVYAVPGVVGAEASYVVLTASMTPEIAPGDVVVVDAVDARSIGVGDVITFQPRGGNGVPVTHRVVAVDVGDDGNPAFLTKGDANEDADVAPVEAAQVVGRVWFVIPVVGYVVQFVGTPVGFVALVVAPLGLLVASELVTLVRHGRRGDDPTASGATDADAFDGGFEPAVVVDDESTGADDANGDVTLTPADLTLTSVALGAFVVYAGYAAYQRPTGLAVAVAVAVGASFVLTVGLRQFGADAPAVTDGGVTVASSATIPDVTLGDRDDAGPRVGVGSLADLHAVAGVVGRPLVRETDGTYLVLDGTVTYAYADEPADWMLAWARDHQRTATRPEGVR